MPTGYINKAFYVASNYEPNSKISFNHADKLNYLARIVSLEANPEDIIIFLDGDAFPIAPIDDYILEKLSTHKLIAVQRLENDGDMQPHPSFSATTVGFWNEINGDWNPGFTWKDKYNNDVTDTGGNLLEKLVEGQIDWHPMIRTNKKNLHPLWFGVYDNMIYHHGAGYRSAVSRLDLNLHNKKESGFLASEQYRRNARLQHYMFMKIKYNQSFYRELI
ncbi:hypothetical protein [Acidithiobacillus ferrivorans]|uniref:hypothetical protein n=1 Tax=Acidithiobacillus ferrivorans TaxID=160808 RepID=UPI0011782831|nr:hypothetical protein [Acidithiobacillus ferrivorans]